MNYDNPEIKFRQPLKDLDNIKQDILLNVFKFRGDLEELKDKLQSEKELQIHPNVCLGTNEIEDRFNRLIKFVDILLTRINYLQSESLLIDHFIEDQNYDITLETFVRQHPELIKQLVQI